MAGSAVAVVTGLTSAMLLLAAIIPIRRRPAPRELVGSTIASVAVVLGAISLTLGDTSDRTVARVALALAIYAVAVGVFALRVAVAPVRDEGE